MAITYKFATGATGTGSTPAVTSGVDTSGSTLIVANVPFFDVGGGEGSLTDFYSNTWTKVRLDEFGFVANDIYYCKNPTVGAGHTFSASHTYDALNVIGFAGTDLSSPLDQQSAAHSVQPGSITPGQANEVLVCALCFYPDGTQSIDSGFTVANKQPYNSGVNMGGAIAYLIETTATAKNPTWSTNTSYTDNIAVILSFKAAVAGSGKLLEVRRKAVLLG